MRKSDLKILIVEDDPTAGKALSEALSRAGYSPRLTSRPREAEQLFGAGDFRLLIVDCMLPKINGVDLVEKFRKKRGTNFEVILTSGVFKDQSFGKQSIRRVNALGFLKKPYDLGELFPLIENAFADVLEEEKEPLYELMSIPNVSENQIIQVIETSEAIQGFDLPIIYTHLLKSRATGILNLINQDGDVSTIHFHEGTICEVNVRDKTSYFGILLIENGFTSSEEVEENLRLENSKPIGLKLVESHALSPHAIQIALTQQMAIRLSKTVQDNSLEIQFSKANIQAPTAALTSETFTELLNDWISSKISVDWLQTLYLPWLEHSVHVNKKASHVANLESSRAGEIDKILRLVRKKDLTLQELMDRVSSSENSSLQTLHFLVIEKVLTLSKSRREKVDFQTKLIRMKEIADNIDDKNLFEILGLNTKARFKEINRSYIELAKALHPDKLAPGAPKELLTLTQKVFARVAEAHNTLSDEDRRRRYLKELELGQAEDILVAERKFEEAEQLLTQGKYSQALRILEKIPDSRAHRSDLPIYLAWAKLKTGCAPHEVETLAGDVRDLLKKVQPEDRHNARFFLVKGLFYMLVGHYGKARVNFKNSSTMDPTLVDPRREMMRLKKIEAQGAQTIADSHTLLGRLFKKRA